jgi:hypothetical protein
VCHHELSHILFKHKKQKGWLGLGRLHANWSSGVLLPLVIAYTMFVLCLWGKGRLARLHHGFRNVCCSCWVHLKENLVDLGLMKGLGFSYPKVKLNEANVRPESLILLLTRNVSQCGLAIYIKKFRKTKEELWKVKYFTMQKYINLQKIL